MRKSFLLSILSLLIASATAQAQHLDDIALGIAESQLVPGVFQVQGASIATVLSQRVFLAQFEVAPDFTTEPGFQSLVGAFEGGSRIGFTIRKALRKWNGSEFPQGPEGIPHERIQIKLGPAANVRLTPLADESVQGFSLEVNDQGQFHQHPGFTLLAPASNGVYLLELELWSTQSGLLSSPPFWVVFGQNVDEAELRAAASWVRSFRWVPSCPGDLNADGFVDDADFTIFVVAYDYLLCDPPGCPADLNGDWVTDDSDFLIFVSAYDTLLCP